MLHSLTHLECAKGTFIFRNNIFFIPCTASVLKKIITCGKFNWIEMVILTKSKWIDDYIANLHGSTLRFIAESSDEAEMEWIYFICMKKDFRHKYLF